MHNIIAKGNRCSKRLTSLCQGTYVRKYVRVIIKRPLFLRQVFKIVWMQSVFGPHSFLFRWSRFYMNHTLLRKKVWSPRDDELISGYLMSHFLSPATTFPSKAWMPPPHRQQFFGQNPWVSAAAEILDAKGSKTHHSIRLYTYTCCQKFLTFIWTKTIGSILAIMVGFTKTVLKPHCKKGLRFFLLLPSRYILAI